MSCNNEESNTAVSTLNHLSIEPIDSSVVHKNDQRVIITYHEGYQCSSSESNLVANIYTNSEQVESISQILDDKGEILYTFKNKIDSYISENSCYFILYDELNQPILRYLYDDLKQQIEIVDIYNPEHAVNATRASAASWGCQLSIGIVGITFSTIVGSVSMGAGAVVGVSYMLLAITMCDGL